MKNKLLKALTALLLMLVCAPAFSLDAKWLEQYKENRNSLTLAVSEYKRRFSQDIMMTKDAVDMRIAALTPEETVSIDQSLLDDYLKVLDGSGSYAYGFEIHKTSADIAAVKNIISASPPFSVDFYDNALYLIERTSDGIKLYSAYFPQHIKVVKDAINTINNFQNNAEKFDEDLTLSVYISYVTNIIDWLDQRIPLLKEAEDKFAAFTPEFTEKDLADIHQSIEKMTGELKAKNPLHPISLYTRQIKLDYLTIIREYMQERFKAMNGALSYDEIWKVKNDIARSIPTAQLEIEYIKGLQNRLANNISDESEEEAVHELAKLSAEFFPRMMFFFERLDAELNEKINRFSDLEKGLKWVRDTAYSLLGEELWSSDGYRITLRKLIFVAIFILVSVLGCKWMSIILSKIFFSRFADNITLLIRKIIFYSLLILSVLISFQIAEIPLTSFAFLGGALMIGIGFGTQNIFNNIISGLILSTSQPFKSGDVINFEDINYTVIDLGDRATHLRMFDGTDAFVQNRQFLESKIVNKTYRKNSRMRLEVCVNVAYGSNHRQVENCLIDLASEHEHVLRLPAPFVAIKNLGDSSIEFALLFWIDLRTANEMIVPSEIRGAILDRFAELGITIPYPKLDVNIKSK